MDQGCLRGSTLFAAQNARPLEFYRIAPALPKRSMLFYVFNLYGLRGVVNEKCSQRKNNKAARYGLVTYGIHMGDTIKFTMTINPPMTQPRIVFAVLDDRTGHFDMRGLLCLCIVMLTKTKGEKADVPPLGNTLGVNPTDRKQPQKQEQYRKDKHPGKSVVYIAFHQDRSIQHLTGWRPTGRYTVLTH